MISRAVAKYLSENVDGVNYQPNLSTGNCFVEFMPSQPNEAVAVMSTGGYPQDTKNASDIATIQILVRNDLNDTTNALALSIYSALQALDLTVLDDAGVDETQVITCQAEQSQPVSIGFDDNNRLEWSLNFRLRVQSLTLNRY